MTARIVPVNGAIRWADELQDGLHLAATCPRCGHELDLHNVGAPVEAGTALNAVLRCINRWCKMEWGLHLRLMPVGVYRDEGEVHGNRLAHNRHKRRGEKPCPECELWRNRNYEDRKKSALAADESTSVA